MASGKSLGLADLPLKLVSLVFKGKILQVKGDRNLLYSIFCNSLFFSFFLLSAIGRLCANSLTRRDTQIFFKQAERDWEKKTNYGSILKSMRFCFKQGDRQKVEEERIKYLCISKEKQYHFSDTVAKWLFIPHADRQIKQVCVVLKWLLICVTSPLAVTALSPPFKGLCGEGLRKITGTQIYQPLIQLFPLLALLFFADGICFIFCWNTWNVWVLLLSSKKPKFCLLTKREMVGSLRKVGTWGS